MDVLCVDDNVLNRSVQVGREHKRKEAGKCCAEASDLMTVGTHIFFFEGFRKFN